MAVENINNPLHGKEWKRGRGYTKYTYTIKDIAMMTNRTIGTVRNDLCRKGIDISDIKKMIEYVSLYRGKHGKKFTSKNIKNSI